MAKSKAEQVKETVKASENPKATDVDDVKKTTPDNTEQVMREDAEKSKEVELTTRQAEEATKNAEAQKAAALNEQASRATAAVTARPEARGGQPTVQKFDENARQLENEIPQPGPLSTSMKSPEQEVQQFVAGFNFDMYSLKELYANLRDGNYWSAFKMVVRVLNENVNVAPIPPRGPRPGIMADRMRNQQVTMTEVDETIEKLEDCCRYNAREALMYAESGGERGAIMASQERNVKEIPPELIFTLVASLVELLKRWRERNR